MYLLYLKVKKFEDNSLILEAIFVLKYQQL